jgi:hypothetical protein
MPHQPVPVRWHRRGLRFLRPLSNRPKTFCAILAPLTGRYQSRCAIPLAPAPRLPAMEIPVSECPLRPVSASLIASGPEPRNFPLPQPKPEVWEGLQAEMRAGHIGGLAEAQAYLRDTWGIAYGIDAISKLFQRRKTKLKTGRPRHRKAASLAEQAAFKK